MGAIITIVEQIQTSNPVPCTGAWKAVGGVSITTENQSWGRTEELLQILNALGSMVTESSTTNKWRTLLASYQRRRHLSLWHDHATILGSGFIMITVHTCLRYSSVPNR